MIRRQIPALLICIMLGCEPAAPPAILPAVESAEVAQARIEHANQSKVAEYAIARERELGWRFVELTDRKIKALATHADGWKDTIDAIDAEMALLVQERAAVFAEASAAVLRMETAKLIVEGQPVAGPGRHMSLAEESEIMDRYREDYRSAVQSQQAAHSKTEETKSAYTAAVRKGFSSDKLDEAAKSALAKLAEWRQEAQAKTARMQKRWMVQQKRVLQLEAAR